MDNRYPDEEVLDDAHSDNGTMPECVDELRKVVVGRKIVSVEKNKQGGYYEGAIITLDDGTKVKMVGTGDCCAYTAIHEFLLHPELVDHMIMGVGTTDQYETWHIYADAGDVLQLTVGWSCGNPFYYGYGFKITVEAN